jgi:hypothetical protein
MADACAVASNEALTDQLWGVAQPLFRIAVGLRLPCSAECSQLEKGVRVAKDKFLTVRWNNLLMLGLGIPTLSLVVVAFSTSSWSGRGALIALSVLGGFF